MAEREGVEFRQVMGEVVRPRIVAPVNVSVKRRRGWEQNYRVADFAVILPDSRAVDYPALVPDLNGERIIACFVCTPAVSFKR